MCLRGSSEVEKQLFEQVPSDRLRGYAVWVAESGASERDVPSAMRGAGDRRIAQLWDGDGLELTAFRAPLQLRSDAWDVYLLYAAGVRWEGVTPPEPTFWMQQLDSLSGSKIPTLDGALLAAKARELLSR